MIKTFLKSLFFIVIVLTFSARGEKNEWKIRKSDSSDRIIMQLSDTEGVTSRKVLIELNNSIEPASAKLEYSNGFSISATSGQIRYYWLKRNAQKAVWDYLYSQGKIETIQTAGLSEIPAKLHGKLVMCLIENSKKRYLGRIEGVDGNKDWFALGIEGAPKPVNFYIPAVEQIWYLK